MKLLEHLNWIFFMESNFFSISDSSCLEPKMENSPKWMQPFLRFRQKVERQRRRPTEILSTWLCEESAAQTCMPRFILTRAWTRPSRIYRGVWLKDWPVLWQRAVQINAFEEQMLNNIIANALFMDYISKNPIKRRKINKETFYLLKDNFLNDCIPVTHTFHKILTIMPTRHVYLQKTNTFCILRAPFFYINIYTSTASTFKVLIDF